jgi:hypothetical protein
MGREYAKGYEEITWEENRGAIWERICKENIGRDMGREYRKSV